ncbi:MAG: helix-turn-helix transcriptional regulator [Cyclobacteriaceae bacterium]
MKVREQEFLSALGERIKEIRKEKGLTQLQLAAKINNHDEQIGRIERAEVNVSASMLYQIAKGLGVELKELVDV